MNAVLRRLTLSIAAIYFDDFGSTSWRKMAQESSAIVNTTVRSLGATITAGGDQPNETASRFLETYTDTQDFHLGTVTTLLVPATVHKMIQMASEYMENQFISLAEVSKLRGVAPWTDSEFPGMQAKVS